MNYRVLGMIVGAVVATLVLVLIFVPPKHFDEEGEAHASTKPADKVVPAPPPAAPAAPARDVRYERDIGEWEKLAALYKAREEKALAASPAPPQQKEKAKVVLNEITEKPLPPPPKQNDPESLDKFETWHQEFNDGVEKKKQDGALGALIGVLCPVAAAAYGTPQAAGLCSLIGPLLEGLGLSLGQGDDIQEVGRALSALENDDFGPMQELMQKSPKLAKDLGNFIDAYKKHEAEIRDAVLGTTALDPPTICATIRNDQVRTKEVRTERLQQAIAAARTNADRDALHTCLRQL